MTTQNNLLQAQVSQIFKKSLILTFMLLAAFMLVSCTSDEDRILHMSQYNPDMGEKPEFMLRGYEDYKIKFSRENVKVENKVSFDQLSSLLEFDED